MRHRARGGIGHSGQTALFTTPPSTRSAAPVVAEDSGLATYATREATSSGLAKRLISEVGLTFSKNSFSYASNVLPSRLTSRRNRLPLANG